MSDLDGFQRIVGDDGMGVGDGSPDVVRLKAGIVVENLVRAHTLGEQAQDQLDGDPHPPDDRLSSEDLRIGGDAVEQGGSGPVSHATMIAPSRTLESSDTFPRPLLLGVVSAARAILEDKPLTGYWFDRTREYAARNSGEEYDRLTYAREETFSLSRLPCWAHLSQEEYRQRVAELVEEIELDARVARLERGLPVLGVGAVLRLHT